MKNIILLALVIFAQSCSVMPYKEQSSCHFNDLGKCLPINEAYKEAVTGKNQGGVLVNGKTNSVPKNAPIVNKTQSLKNNDQSNIYTKIQTMVKQESMPLLKPAVVRRILIMPYQSKDAQIWNGSRHVYYIEQKPRWLLSKANKTNKDNKTNKANKANRAQNYLDIY